MTLIVQDIFIYPVKSLRGIWQQAAHVTREGLEHDRRLMIADANGRLVSQREIAELATFKTALDENGHVTFTPPGGESITVRPEDFGAATADIKIFRNECKGETAAAEINDALSAALGREAKLVRVSTQHPRPVDPAFAQPGDTVGFADGFPLLITNTASLQALQPHFNDATVTMDRFRPNIVVNSDTPFAEDLWETIRIGDVIFDTPKACSRCIVTTTDQQTGQRPGKEPIETLGKLRRGQRGVFFGINAIPRNTGTIRAGDTVEILKMRETLDDMIAPTKLNALNPSV